MSQQNDSIKQSGNYTSNGASSYNTLSYHQPNRPIPPGPPSNIIRVNAPSSPLAPCAATKNDGAYDHPDGVRPSVMARQPLPSPTYRFINGHPRHNGGSLNVASSYQSTKLAGPVTNDHSGLSSVLKTPNTTSIRRHLQLSPRQETTPPTWPTETNPARLSNQYTSPGGYSARHSNHPPANQRLNPATHSPIAPRLAAPPATTSAVYDGTGQPIHSNRTPHQTSHATMIDYYNQIKSIHDPRMSHVSSYPEGQNAMESPLDFKLHDIPLPCAYLQLPWRADRSWARLKSAVSARPNPSARESFVMCQIKDIVSRMIVERMTVHPTVYIVRYTHFQDGLIASMLPEILLNGIERGVPPMKDPQVTDKLFEVSRVIYSGTHTLGAGFSVEGGKPFVQHFVSNGGHCVTQVYLKTTIDTLPNSWNELLRLWAPVRKALVENQHRYHGSARTDEDDESNIECNYNDNFETNPLVDRSKVSKHMEGRLGHIVVLYDLRFDNSSNSVHWCPEYMRRWVWVCALTHAMLNAWLAVETQGRSLQILLLPPTSFSLMVDEGIVKVNAARGKRKEMHPHFMVDHYIKQREDENKQQQVVETAKVVKSDTEKKKKKAQSKGLLSFCMSGGNSDSSPKSVEPLHIEKESPKPRHATGVVADYPYTGLDDEAISATDIRPKVSAVQGGFWGSKQKTPARAAWDDNAEFNQLMMTNGITSPKTVKQMRNDFSMSVEDASEKRILRLENERQAAEINALKRAIQSDAMATRKYPERLDFMDAKRDVVYNNGPQTHRSHAYKDTLQGPRPKIRSQSCSRSYGVGNHHHHRGHHAHMESPLSLRSANYPDTGSTGNPIRGEFLLPRPPPLLNPNMNDLTPQSVTNDLDHESNYFTPTSHGLSSPGTNSKVEHEGRNEPNQQQRYKPNELHKKVNTPKNNQHDTDVFRTHRDYLDEFSQELTSQNLSADESVILDAAREILQKRRNRDSINTSCDDRSSLRNSVIGSEMQSNMSSVLLQQFKDQKDLLLNLTELLKASQFKGNSVKLSPKSED